LELDVFNTAQLPFEHLVFIDTAKTNGLLNLILNDVAEVCLTSLPTENLQQACDNAVLNVVESTVVLHVIGVVETLSFEPSNV
jgi:hypothetical protein